jgi:protein involved in polysaccharide export with SLBB domain
MRHLLLLTGLLILASCSTTPSNEQDYEKLVDAMARVESEAGHSKMINIDDIPQFEETKDLMAPGFLFSLSHPSDERLSGRFRIDHEGVLLLPYNVKIKATGLTFAQLRDKVIRGFESFFQGGAQETRFRLVEKKYFVEVRGLVKKSGRYLVDRNESIDKVISKAGGIDGDMKKDFFSVSLKQMKRSYSISLNQYYENNVAATPFTWTGEDTLFVNLLSDGGNGDTVATITVLGGVQNPGKVLYQDRASLFYYLSKSGGVIPNLGYQEAYVIRSTGTGLQKIHFNITKVETIPTIKPHDVILLNGEKRTTMDKFFERLTQVSAVLSTIAFFIIAF